MPWRQQAQPTQLSEETVHRVHQQVETDQTAEDMRRALAVILPAELGAAQVLGIGLATLKRDQTGLFREAHHNGFQRHARGGRHNETISIEAERTFLGEWAQQSAEGGVAVVGQIRDALQSGVGAEPPLCTLYRMLARRGWRKVAPDTRRSKSDPAAQAVYKKFPRLLAAARRANRKCLKTRLMFQGEARFDR